MNNNPIKTRISTPFESICAKYERGCPICVSAMHFLIRQKNITVIVNDGSQLKGL